MERDCNARDVEVEVVRRVPYALELSTSKTIHEDIDANNTKNTDGVKESGKCRFRTLSENIHVPSIYTYHF